MSASTSLQLFFSSLVIFLVLTPILTVATYQWWATRQKAQRQQAFLEQAQAYALLTNNNPPYTSEQMNHPQPNKSQDWTVIQ